MKLVLFSLYIDRYFKEILTIWTVLFCAILNTFFKVHQVFLFYSNTELVDGFVELPDVEVLDSHETVVLHPVKEGGILDTKLL